MILKIATIACMLALAQPATIQQRNIPVEVKYDEAASEVAKVTALDEKASTDSSSSEEPKISAVRNLDEKVQLSPDDLTQASKHLPVVEEISLKNLGDVARSEEVVTPAPTSLQSVLQQAEDIIYSGLKKLRNSFKADKDQQAPNPQQWDDFEKSVNEYLNEEKSKLQVKQGQPPQQNQNIFQNIAQGFQTVANNFIQNLVPPQEASGNTTNLGDEQQGGQQGQGPFQGFVSFFQNGVNNLVTNINNLGNQGPTTSNTVLGDTGTATTQAPSLVSNLVNNVQQFFGQIQGAVQGGGSSGTQGDTGVNSTSSSSPQGPGQIIQSIGSAINQFIQGRPPNAPGDEGTATTEANVNIIQSIGNVIQNSPLNPFRPPQKPAEGGATSNPIQAGISGAQNIGNQIQQLIPGQASSTEASKLQEEPATEQTSPIKEETSNELAPEKAKGIDLEAVENAQEEQKKEEVVQEEIKEEQVKEQMEEQVKEQMEEQVKEQMEEQVKQEEIKEEIRQEEMKEKVEEKNPGEDKKEEIMMTAE